MDLRQLRVVVTIAEYGSVSRAASALHQSPSSVSHTLAGLERDLGVELFRRLPRGMVLTAYGEAFIGPARRTLREAESAGAAVGAVRGLLAGQVRLVSLPLFTAPLAELVASFARQHPQVVMRLRQPTTELEVAVLLRSGDCELGIMRDGNVPSDLDAMPIATERGVAVVPDGHPLARRDTIGLEDLDGEPVVAPPATSPLRAIFDEVFAHGDVTPRVVAEADDHEMVLELVRSGVGATIASEASAQIVTWRGAVARQLYPPRASTLMLAAHRGQPLTPGSAAFRDLAVREYRAP